MLKECEDLARSLELDEILTENHWDIKDFETPEEIGAELRKDYIKKKKNILKKMICQVHILRILINILKLLMRK